MSDAPKLCEDEGCPHFGTDHICINRDALIKELIGALNQSRLAFAGYVSAQSAIDKLDSALAHAKEAGYGAR